MKKLKMSEKMEIFKEYCLKETTSTSGRETNYFHYPFENEDKLSKLSTYGLDFSVFKDFMKLQGLNYNPKLKGYIFEENVKDSENKNTKKSLADLQKEFLEKNKVTLIDNYQVPEEGKSKTFYSNRSQRINDIESFNSKVEAKYENLSMATADGKYFVHFNEIDKRNGVNVGNFNGELESITYYQLTKYNFETKRWTKVTKGGIQNTIEKKINEGFYIPLNEEQKKEMSFHIKSLSETQVKRKSISKIEAKKNF